MSFTQIIVGGFILIGLLLMGLGAYVDSKPGGDGYGRGGIVPMMLGAFLLTVGVMVWIFFLIIYAWNIL